MGSTWRAFGCPLKLGSPRSPVAGSEAEATYETKAGAKKGIDAVQRAAAGAKIEDLTDDS